MISVIVKLRAAGRAGVKRLKCFTTVNFFYGWAIKCLSAGKNLIITVKSFFAMERSLIKAGQRSFVVARWQIIAAKMFFAVKQCLVVTMQRALAIAHNQIAAAQGSLASARHQMVTVQRHFTVVKNQFITRQMSFAVMKHQVAAERNSFSISRNKIDAGRPPPFIKKRFRAAEGYFFFHPP
jgi:hypothetical protein